MIGSFRFNNVESESFKLVCKSVKRPLLPGKKVSRTEILGASGAYDFHEDEYDITTLTMHIAYIGTDFQELRTRARQIAAWLATKAWGKLIINDEPDKYYLAKVIGEIDLDNMWELGSADVVFDCQPFAYSVTEVISSATATGATNISFTHPGTRTINFKSPQGSKFLIKVTGSWTTLSLGLNGSVITFSEAGSGAQLIVNNVDMEVTKDGVNKFSKVEGNIDTFLKVIPGTNTLAVTGTGLNATVSVEFIPMWM